MKRFFFAVRRGEIKPDEIYTLGELAELFSTFHPDMFRSILHIAHKGLDYEFLLDEEHYIYGNGRKDMILTKCEREVLILVGRGLTNREIAGKLYISLHAVSTFLYRASVKLGAHNRVDSVVFALKRGEISMGDIYLPNELIQALATLEAESIEKIAKLLEQESRQELVPVVS